MIIVEKFTEKIGKKIFCILYIADNSLSKSAKLISKLDKSEIICVLNETPHSLGSIYLALISPDYLIKFVIFRIIFGLCGYF